MMILVRFGLIGHFSTHFVVPLHEALDPSQNGCEYDHDTALRHQIAHVAITQLVSDIPSHGLNDKKMVEMTAFDEFGLLGKDSGHADDYP
jgi:hypothetical protein